MMTHVEKLPTLSAIVVDLRAGEVRERATGRVLTHLASWNDRERVIATEMFLATHAGPGGLSLLDMALIWHSWLEHASSLQHVRNMFNPFRSGINNALRSYGWLVRNSGFARWTLERDRNEMVEAAPIAAAGAIAPLRTAYDAFARGHYAATTVSAVEALSHCGESRYARLLIGTCRFVHGQEVERCVEVETAKHVLDFRSDLDRAIAVLSRLWRDELHRRPRRWEFVPDQIRQYEEQRGVYHEMFEKAQDYLCGE